MTLRRWFPFAAGVAAAALAVWIVWTYAEDWFLVIPAGALLVPLGALALMFARVEDYPPASMLGWTMLGYGAASAFMTYSILAAGAG